MAKKKKNYKKTGGDLSVAAISHSSKDHPTHVVIEMKIPYLEEYSFVATFGSREQVDSFINQMAHCRNLVWPDAEPLDLSGQMPEEADHD